MNIRFFGAFSIFLFFLTFLFADQLSISEKSIIDNTYIISFQENKKPQGSIESFDEKDAIYEYRKPSKFDFFQDFQLAFKVAYFYPQDISFRDVYPGGLIYGVEASYPVYNSFAIFFDVSYFQKKSKIAPKSRLYLIPFSLGLKYNYDLVENLNLSLKLGPNIFHAKAKSKQQKVNINGFGLVLGVGMDFKFRAGWMLSTFVDYMYDKKSLKIDENRIDYFGGIQAGGGLTYRF